MDRYEPPAPTAVDAHRCQTAADEVALRFENGLLHLALDKLPQGLCMFDGQDRLVLFNRRYHEIWQMPAVLLQRGTPFAAIAAQIRGTEIDCRNSHPPQRRGDDQVRRRVWQLEDGRTVEVTVTRLADGSTVALHDDITAERQAQDQIAYLATHDPLTGLANRSALRDALAAMLARNARGEELAVLCLDLDRFKPVNDSLGHAAGDELLRCVAARLQAHVRDTDVVARIGGDEFAVLQCGVSQPASSSALARRLIAALQEPFEIEGQRAEIGTSIGIAIAPFDGQDPEALLKSSDLAMYRAKSDGRGLLRYFEPAMDQQIQLRRGLESDLRRALARGEFHLAYQPQVDVKSGRVIGVEALLRWTHPGRGPVAPSDFIGLAEETGLIVPIGQWVLAQACRQARAWPDPVSVAVNVSAVQFSKGTLLHDVTQALADSGLPASRLEIEITESVLIKDQRLALALLKDLQSLGVRVAMDDFGTGYSSLSTLRSFPFDRIKIDRSFVRDVESSPESQSIVRAVAGLGRSLGMAVTVEGVETPGQLATVCREGCTEVQGYLFSRPVAAEHIPELIDAIATGAAPTDAPG